ncbi:MAG: carbon-nitrogen hydrolase family protein [Pseudomonadales bacterium]
MSEQKTLDTITVAAIQMEPRLNDKAGNMAKALSCIDEASAAGARLVIFPECALTAYVFEDSTETAAAAESVPGPSTEILTKKAKEKDVYIVAGMVETHESGFYNVSVLVGPEGYIGKYRKMHPWYPAEEAWPITRGESDQGFPVFKTEIGNIGMCICYDMWIPETARMLALNGADIIAFPTNTVAVPAGEAVFDHVLRTRALENHVWIVGADRIGVEREVPFAGRSQIVDPYGNVMVEASADREEIIYADIQPAIASNDKMLVPELPAADLWWIRRPDSYSKISSTD